MTDKLKGKLLTPEERSELESMRSRLFELANEKAGNESGNASIHLHESVNNINNAIACFEAGNSPSEPIPAFAAMRSMGMMPSIRLSSPTVPTPPESDELTRDIVWERSGRFLVGYSEKVCPIWGDTIPYKSATFVCDEKDEARVTYWIEYVHGGNSIVRRKLLPDGKVALRSDYQCW